MPSPSSLQEPSADPSPAQKTLVDERAEQRFSASRRYVLLIIFCLAQFIDAVNNSMLYSGIPRMVIALHMSESESTWIISAFQLTFASFLLISGRISDVYNPKQVFIAGIFSLGIINLGAGFSNDKIALIICRALAGVAASLTIPSALTLLVNVFSEPAEQARAIGIFGGCGAVGVVLGLIIGALFVEFASWRWVFWFVPTVAIPVAVACLVLVPASASTSGSEEPEVDSKLASSKWKSLDLGGVTILTAALILFIFAVTSGSTDGWGSATVLAPLVISIFMVAGFFYFETKIPADQAAVPPATWFLPNFAVLFGSALLPYFWWTAVFVTYTTLWQDIYGWSAISSAERMIPIGVLSLVMSFTGSLSRVINSKWIILMGDFLMVIATILLALADSPDRYWPYVFPAFILGSGGATLTFVHTNIAIFRTSPASMAGTVGAIFNGALQLGSAVGISAVSSIETSVEKTHGGPTKYTGRAAAFWFLLALVGVETIAMLIFYRIRAEDTDRRDRSKETPQPESISSVDEKTDSKSRESTEVEVV